MNDGQLMQIALDCGAAKAALITQDDIVLSASFRALCEANSCGVYGRCYTCPPDVGPIDELMARVRRYDRALLYQTIGDLEDSYDIEGMAEAKKAHVAVGQRLLDALAPVLGLGAMHLSGGGCGLCATCGKITGEPCRHPDRALASLESCGIDVYNTTRRTALKYINGANTVTYFGMVLFQEDKNG